MPYMPGYRHYGGKWLTYVESFSVATEDTTPQGVYVHPDGTFIYVLGSVNNHLYEYEMGTPWNLSTASYVRTRNISALDAFYMDFTFSSDGTQLIVVDQGNGRAREYSLSSAWDISTTSFVRSQSTAAQSSSMSGCCFGDSGNKLYLVSAATDLIYEYDLGTAWSLSSFTFSQSFSLAAIDTSPLGVFFSSDGLKMFIAGSAADAIHQYTLGTAWDISTATYVRSGSVVDQETVISGLFFKSDLTKAYIVGQTSDSIHEYTVS